jgi:hypothetical protein
VFLTQNKAKLCKILIITLVFEKNAIFSPKIGKNRRKLALKLFDECTILPPSLVLARGRCYDHNFLRFFPIFSEKFGVFLKNHVMIKIVHNLALFCVKNANFFAKFFGENI